MLALVARAPSLARVLPHRAWGRASQAARVAAPPRGVASALAWALACACALPFAGCSRGGGGAAAALGFDPTQQPAALAGANLIVSGGDGGEGIDGAPAGTVDLEAASAIACRPAGSAPVAGEYAGATDTPDDPDRLHVAAGATLTLTAAELAAGPGGGGQPWSSIAIDGTLVIEAATTTTSTPGVVIEVEGDARVAGRIEHAPPDARPQVTLTGQGGRLLVSGTIDLVPGTGGPGAPRLEVAGFTDVLVSGAIDLGGRSAPDASDGGEVVIDATGFAVIAGSIAVRGGSGGEDPTSAGTAGRGGRVAIAADTIVLRGAGIEGIGGQGGAFNPAQPQITPGDGGAGASIALEAPAVEVAAGSTIRVSGGRANGPNEETRQGGAGGEVTIAAGAELSFAGAIDAVGGFSPFGLAGEGGRVLLSAEPATSASFAVGGSVFAQGGGALGGASGGGAAQGGPGGVIEVELRGASTTLALTGFLRAHGGPSVGTAAAGAGGAIFAGAGRRPPPAGAYAALAGHAVLVRATLGANGGAASAAASRGAGGRIDLHAALLDLSGVLEALGATPPGEGRIVARTATALGIVNARMADDDGDADGIDGALDRSDTP